MSCVFVTGTDTEVGKTFVSCALLERLAQGGVATLAMKPVAAGAVQTKAGLRNEDAVQLQSAMSVPSVPYEAVNPVCFEAPIAPHIAAATQQQVLTVSHLASAAQQLQRSYPHDLFLVEGAGGWLVPLNQQESLADLALALNAKVVLVVGMKLGCLNHALLTYAELQRQAVEVVGWVANQVSETPMQHAEENLAWLQRHLPVPLLANLPYLATASNQAASTSAVDYFPDSQTLMSLLQGKGVLSPA
ncbi:dethiobiotin synthase [Pseudidiomarina sediminum]|uniref:ATP-dependent dethiobiotin synthetase BioD n=1 Tax=Pseudidiomarina sediminum TaxID=431675 RepID=A0A432Z7W2_9GAMM|nr:dethiobiotin synthase [Pseudidiomarina sediminum]RUO73969.1 dethiobiotin synthase [Pseudidiomarina sediminum]